MGGAAGLDSLLRAKKTALASNPIRRRGQKKERPADTFDSPRVIINIERGAFKRASLLCAPQLLHFSIRVQFA